jgi:hypothetical protein
MERMFAIAKGFGTIGTNQTSYDCRTKPMGGITGTRRVLPMTDFFFCAPITWDWQVSLDGLVREALRVGL